ncbi:hypothetical protein KY316_00585 [Candidatus Woesearchaeota archaeon]|nr:hypothetical protein [Candidatus Woesearchaeota archaeon]
MPRVDATAAERDFLKSIGAKSVREIDYAAIARGLKLLRGKYRQDYMREFELGLEDAYKTGRKSSYNAAVKSYNIIAEILYDLNAILPSEVSSIRNTVMQFSNIWDQVWKLVEGTFSKGFFKVKVTSAGATYYGRLKSRVDAVRKTWRSLDIYMKVAQKKMEELAEKKPFAKAKVA